MVAVIRLKPGTVDGNRRGLRASCERACATSADVSEIAWTVVLVATIGVLGLNMPVILAAFARSGVLARGSAATACSTR